MAGQVYWGSQTGLICDDISWQLSKRGEPSQYALAERCLGYMRSHKKGTMDIYIGQQQIYGLPPQLRKLVSTWFIFPKAHETKHLTLGAITYAGAR